MPTSTRAHTTLTGFLNSYGFIAHSKIGMLLGAGLKNKYLVEIVGTFILVYAICSAATVYSGNVLLGIVGLGQLQMIGVGLVHAFVLTAIVYA
ncbi:MAG: hypothetical protein QOK70_08740, partial [Nitrososphaeraceae archaeon]|nr:hypothetical protein [Nitrososphaeraceae archaeon]